MELCDYFNIHDYANVEYFNNPNPQFRGFAIYSSNIDLSEYNLGGSTRQKFDVLWNGKGLQKDKEFINVELKRKEKQ